MARVRVEIESEAGTSDRPARVLVYEDNQLMAEVVAEIELKQGADGGYYHCVTLKKVGPPATPEVHLRPCRHEWSVIREGPPPHWDKRCRLCGKTETMTSEEAFAD